MDKIERNNRIRFVLQILLPILCLLWAGFIVGNSLKTREQSSEQSTAVVETVQQVAQVIAPESKVATATGEDYLQLHSTVRKLAHFTEFAVWGALLCGCYFAYTSEKKWLWIPACGLVGLPIFDELLQKFVSGRAGELTDVLIDVSGAICGFAVVFGLMIWILSIIRRKKCKNKV